MGVCVAVAFWDLSTVYSTKTTKITIIVRGSLVVSKWLIDGLEIAGYFEW